MAVIDVYSQYFKADCVYNEVERRGVRVTLTATSECGMIQYEVAVSFFLHRDEEDFAVSYDAYASKEIYNAKGRRSKKREKVYLQEIQKHADELAAQMAGKIFWDKPLNEACFD